MAAALSAGALDMNCDVCTKIEWKREAWGCDAERRAPVARVRCWGCLGRGCPSCRLGQRDVFRCPNATLPSGIWEVLSLYALWENGVLPVGTGVLDQAETFYRAMQLLGSEIGRHRRERAERA